MSSCHPKYHGTNFYHRDKRFASYFVFEILIVLFSVFLAPPSVKIIDKPDSGQYILEEGADLKLRCQVSFKLT